MHRTYFDSTLTNSHRKQEADKWTGIGAFALLTLLYGLFFIHNFSGPLAEPEFGDTDQWEYMGYYLLKNLSFNGLPHLNLVNNQTFYPYGTNHVFQGWAFESNIWFALGYRFFGTGPWLNLYYLLSLLICSAGTYLLVRLDYSNRHALLAGFVVSFLNFYALNKYPGHFAYSTIHWTVLSILSDFLLVRRVVLNQAVSLRFILLKVLLLALCLGLDVGYIMGYALSSWTLSLLFIIGVFLYRAIKQPDQVVTYLRQTATAWLQQWRPIQSTALLLAIGLLLFLYVPLLVQVMHATSTFTFENRFAGGHGWMHPVRLLFPLLPGINTIDNPMGLVDLLHDAPEGPGAGSPGWFVLGLGVIGFSYTPRAVRWAYIPLGIFFILHLIYHPVRIPSLQIFPWCRFNRAPSRVTLMYPVIAAILSLYIPHKLKAVVWVPLLVVGLLEMSTAYQHRLAWKPYYFPASFTNYMDRVRQQPGEAVLDWPFCVVGGNGIGGANGLCPVYKTCMLYALKRFHGKKTVGQYFGRLHTDQIDPFIQAGWPPLLAHADSPNFLHASQLTSCLTEEQWLFFDRFYTFNDFAGINLCIDLMPKSCVEAFYTRYGQPVATTEMPVVGRIVFIPKSAEARARLNSQLGKQIRFPCGCEANTKLSGTSVANSPS